MKQARKNEIDLLLRRLGRREWSESIGPSAVGAPGQRLDNEHLDPDELNSYAENALPAAARARYTEHLADCGRCRRIVAQLSLASGAVSQKPQEGVGEKSGWKKYVLNLFSPVVFRYVVPALAAIAILAVGLIVFQRPNSTYQVAQKHVAETPPVAAGEQQRETQQTPAEGLVAKEERTQTTVSAVDKGRADEIGQGTKAPPATSADDSRRRVEEPGRDQPAKLAAEPPPAPAAAAAPAAPKPTVTDAVAENTDVAQRKKQPSEQAVSSKVEDRKSDEVSTAPAPGREAQRAPATGGLRGAVSAGPAQRANAAKEKDGAETRSVAGRRFRREGNVWVDVSYDSSQSTVGLIRGSEQYRALVADEPAIRTIAEQLSGEVIVVWKGRAYRIR